MGSEDGREFRRQIERIESLIATLEQPAGHATQAAAQELVRRILDLYGAGLTRICDWLEAAGEPGRSIREAMAGDDLVRSLLLLHGLHPLDAEARVLEALDQVRPYLRSHGGDVELLAVADGVARLRLTGSCHGCPSSAATMKRTIEEAILDRAPDVVAIEVEGVVEGPGLTPDGRALVVLEAR